MIDYYGSRHMLLVLLEKLGDWSEKLEVCSFGDFAVVTFCCTVGCCAVSLKVIGFQFSSYIIWNR